MKKGRGVKYPGPGPTGVCPVTGLPFFRKPECTDVDTGSYRTRVTFLSDRIILNQVSGYTTLETTKKALQLASEMIDKVVPAGREYVYIADYCGLNGASLEARKYFINHMKTTQGLDGLIFLGTSTLFNISIKLGKWLNIVKFDVRIAKDYEEAIKLALRILSEKDRVNKEGSPLSTANFFSSHLGGPPFHHILRNDDWYLDLNGFSTRFEVIDRRILHSFSYGYMEERHVEYLRGLRQRVLSALVPKGEFDYIIANVKELRGGHRRARRLYMDSLKAWNEEHPFKMYIFYGTNRFMRTAAHLASPFMPFKVRVTKDLDEAMEIIKCEDMKLTAPLTKSAAVPPDDRLKATDLLESYVEQLLQFIGSINWDSQKLDHGLDLDTSHPFKPVFDAIALIKEELDDLLQERQRSEAALRMSEENYRDLVENIGEVIFTMDTKGLITYISPAIEAVLHYRPEEIIGRSILDLVHKKDLPRLKGLLKEALSGHLKVDEYRLVHKPRGVHWVRTHLRPIQKADTVVGFRGVLVDITESKTLQARLQKAEKMEAIGTLAGGVAHDLNNILSGLVSYPELLLLDLTADSPLRKPLMTIKKSGEKATAMVQDLLTLARRGVDVDEVINLNQSISDYLKSLEFEKLVSFHPGLQVEAKLEIDLLNIKGSPIHISKIIMNLVSNAAEAMPNGGEITIKTQNQYLDRPLKENEDFYEGDYVTFSISDSGIGISQEDMEMIFEPFYTKKVMGRSGTGLGMAVVWAAVKDHKGFIDLKSAVGVGTAFTLYFPATREPLVTQSDLSPDEYKGNGESIFIIDDVEEQREIASRILKRLGYSVESVSSGEGAVNFLKENSANLVILDMIMDPGIDGLETYRRILEIHPRQKAIISSGFSESEKVLEAQRLGAGAYVKKPYTLEKIGLAVKNELSRC